MNAVISNKYQSQLATLDIDVIKSLNGEFEVDDIISNFKNFYFNKMILDITAIKDYNNISNIQKLSIGFDMSKVILFLDEESFTPSFLSQLVSMGIYNFTKDLQNIKDLMNKPNSYKNVVQFQQINTNNDKENNDVNNNQTKEKTNNIINKKGKDHINNLNNKQIKEQIDDSNNNQIKESTNSLDNNQIKEPTNNLDNKNNVSNNTQINDQGPIKTRIIGLKNVTENAGSTTLTYILKKYLEKAYKVMAIEMDKKDFLLFNDKELVSTDEEDFPTTIIKGKDKDVILIDLNNSSEIKDCDEVIYLVEPSIIKLNKIMRKNKNTFTELKGKKIVLNKSLISDKDVKEFEYESKSKVFFNMSPLNDKSFDNHVVEDFLIKLGFDRLQTDVKPKRFKWFK